MLVADSLTSLPPIDLTLASRGKRGVFAWRGSVLYDGHETPRWKKLRVAKELLWLVRFVGLVLLRRGDPWRVLVRYMPTLLHVRLEIRNAHDVF